MPFDALTRQEFGATSAHESGVHVPSVTDAARSKTLSDGDGDNSMDVDEGQAGRELAQGGDDLKVVEVSSGADQGTAAEAMDVDDGPTEEGSLVLGNRPPGFNEISAKAQIKAVYTDRHGNKVVHEERRKYYHREYRPAAARDADSYNMEELPGSPERSTPVYSLSSGSSPSSRNSDIQMISGDVKVLPHKHLRNAQQDLDATTAADDALRDIKARYGPVREANLAKARGKHRPSRQELKEALMREKGEKEREEGGSELGGKQSGGSELGGSKGPAVGKSGGKSNLIDVQQPLAKVTSRIGEGPSSDLPSITQPAVDSASRAEDERSGGNSPSASQPAADGTTCISHEPISESPSAAPPATDSVSRAEPSRSDLPVAVQSATDSTAKLSAGNLPSDGQEAADGTTCFKDKPSRDSSPSASQSAAVSNSRIEDKASANDPPIADTESIGRSDDKPSSDQPLGDAKSGTDEKLGADQQLPAGDTSRVKDKPSSDGKPSGNIPLGYTQSAAYNEPSSNVKPNNEEATTLHLATGICEIFSSSSLKEKVGMLKSMDDRALYVIGRWDMDLAMRINKMKDELDRSLAAEREEQDLAASFIDQENRYMYEAPEDNTMQVDTQIPPVNLAEFAAAASELGLNPDPLGLASCNVVPEASGSAPLLDPSLFSIPASLQSSPASVAGAREPSMAAGPDVDMDEEALVVGPFEASGPRASVGEPRVDVAMELCEEEPGEQEPGEQGESGQGNAGDAPEGCRVEPSSVAKQSKQDEPGVKGKQAGAPEQSDSELTDLDEQPDANQPNIAAEPGKQAEPSNADEQQARGKQGEAAVPGEGDQSDPSVPGDTNQGAGDQNEDDRGNRNQSSADRQLERGHRDQCATPAPDKQGVDDPSTSGQKRAREAPAEPSDEARKRRLVQEALSWLAAHAALGEPIGKLAISSPDQATDVANLVKGLKNLHRHPANGMVYKLRSDIENLGDDIDLLRDHTDVLRVLRFLDKPATLEDALEQAGFEGAHSRSIQRFIDD